MTFKDYARVGSGYLLMVFCMNPYDLLYGLTLETLLKYKVSLLIGEALRVHVYSLLFIID